ncbi:MAG: hypothetical protein ACYC4L_02690 [Chloroflexota bacterium]
MSRLLKLLEGVRRGGQSFGFAARLAAPQAPLAIVVAIEDTSAERVSAVVGAGADAVALAIPPQTFPQTTVLESLAAAAGDKPLGLLFPGTGTGEPPADDWWQSSGLDFIVFSTEQSAALLSLDVARIVQVEIGLDPVLMRAMDGLTVDALVAAPRAASSELSVGDAARYRLLVGLTGKPMMVALNSIPTVAELKALVQIGIDGLLVMPAALSKNESELTKSLSDLRAVVGGLGPRRQPKGRDSRGVPLLPHLAGTPAVEEADEEE